MLFVTCRCMTMCSMWWESVTVKVDIRVEVAGEAWSGETKGQGQRQQVVRGGGRVPSVTGVQQQKAQC